VGIQERVELIGGIYSLAAEPGKGVLLRVYAPLTKENEA
jgi:signal transduction histidine kinase